MRALVALLPVLVGCTTARFSRLGGDPPPADSDPALESAYQQSENAHFLPSMAATQSRRWLGRYQSSSSR